MMDCRKPSSGFIDNMQDELMEEGLKVMYYSNTVGQSHYRTVSIVDSLTLGQSHNRTVSL